MAENKIELLKGPLDLLVLKALALGPLTGLDVSNRNAQITQGPFQVKPESLLPALHRTEGARSPLSGENPRIIARPSIIA
jgi:PadR family transcriptional regulator